ncbi:MAG TPA: hypothetical protein VKR21_00800 [Solirubrobacteraceae bacterium]|nr:hypothetical protein [Solirubrobacteraceae bacterium]
MTDKLRIRLAAAVTALFLAGVSGAGLAAHANTTPVAAPAAAQTAPPTSSNQAIAPLPAPDHSND